MKGWPLETFAASKSGVRVHSIDRLRALAAVDVTWLRRRRLNHPSSIIDTGS